MAEIFREPITFEDLHGREFTVFDEDHTHGDILKYVVDDLGYSDAHLALDLMEEADAPDEEGEGPLDPADQLSRLYEDEIVE